MIDLSTEQVIPLTAAAKSLPTRRKGKPPHVATLYRWAKRGLKGIRLETIPVGGTLCTSHEALQRFCERLAHREPVNSNIPPHDSTAGLIERQLDEHGI